MTPKHKSRVAPLVAALAACGGSSATTPENSTASETPAAAAAFDALEQRLLDAGELEITARIESTGAVASALEGSLVIEGERVLLGFEGQFAGEPVSPGLTSDGRIMAGGNGELTFEVETAPALHEGLLVGLTRMGMLHNLAVLSSGNPPQGIYGDARTWVTVSDVTRVDDHLAFDITVDGRPAAAARLWLDPDTGLPARREQTVRFPNGVMTVAETYETFRVED